MQPIWHNPSAVRVAFSDASNTGYGGYTVEHGKHGGKHGQLRGRMFQASPCHLALYMQHLSESTHSKSAVEEVVHALSWLYKVAGFQPPSSSPLVQSTLEGLRRKVAKPKSLLQLIC